MPADEPFPDAFADVAGYLLGLTGDPELADRLAGDALAEAGGDAARGQVFGAARRLAAAAGATEPRPWAEVAPHAAGDGVAWDAARALPADLRDAYVLHALYGLSAADVATALGADPATVKQRVFDAREALSPAAGLGGPRRGASTTAGTRGSRPRVRRAAAWGAGVLALVVAVAAGAVALDRGDDRAAQTTPAPAEDRAAQTTPAPAEDGPGPGLIITDTVAARHRCTRRQRGAVPEPVADEGYCLFVSTYQTPLTPGVGHVTAVELCRRTGLGTDTLRLTGTEVVAWAEPVAGGERVRHWGVEGGSLHDVTLGGGECRIWGLRWKGEDDRGGVVPAGRYYVYLRLLPVVWEAGHPAAGTEPVRADISVLSPR